MTWNRAAILAAVPVAAMAFIAGVVSFSHIEALGLRTGQSITDARLLPLAVDGLIVLGRSSCWPAEAKAVTAELHDSAFSVGITVNLQ